MARRLIIWGAIGLLLAGGIAYSVPASRYPLLAFLGYEKLHDGRPIRYWVEAMTSADPAVRRRAALNLGDANINPESAQGGTEYQQAIAALVNGLGDADGFVRKCAATSFLMYPLDGEVPADRASVGRMIGALGDSEVVVRRAAVRGLWQAGASAQEGGGVARLTESLADSDDFVRAYAARALARIGPDAKDAVPALLVRLRQDENRDVRKLAAKTLGLIGAKAIGPRLPETVAALKEGLKGEPPGLREYAARSLGQLRAREAVADLTKAMEDRDAKVRGAAAEALKALATDAGGAAP